MENSSRLLIEELRERLKKAVTENVADGMLFSGGLDTAILAYLNPGSLAVNVRLENYGEDIDYAKILAEKLKLKLVCRNVSVEEALAAVPEVIRILKSFDPAIPNDLTVYFGLKTACEKGFREVMTGDGADELFGGYSYMGDMKELNNYIRRLSKKMFFNSNRLGDFFNTEIKQPYIDKKMIEIALKTPADLKIGKEKGILHGKWILRKAFEKVLPAKIIWQNKRPLEVGSGMAKLREIILSNISDAEFEEKKKRYPIKFFSKEHLYYYEIYRKEVGKIPAPVEGDKQCSGCGAGMREEASHCRVCGMVTGELND